MTPLHIPLALLPGPVPMGTPLVIQHPGCDAFPAVFLRMSGNYVDCASPMPAGSRDRDWLPQPVDTSVWIDLTPPPIDANGNPTRIDALPVLVDMLARAMGHPEGVRVFRGGSIRPSAWTLETWAHGENVSTFTLFTHDVGAPHDGTTHGGWTMAATETREIIRRLPRIPALASIDLTDPNATRLALVALLAARVWETA